MSDILVYDSSGNLRKIGSTDIPREQQIQMVRREIAHRARTMGFKIDELEVLEVTEGDLTFVFLRSVIKTKYRIDLTTGEEVAFEVPDPIAWGEYLSGSYRPRVVILCPNLFARIDSDGLLTWAGA